MKQRRGFVSNSSSSSFIIGCGKVKDFALFTAWCRKNDISDKYLRVLTTHQVFTGDDEIDYWHGTGMWKCDGDLRVMACVNSEPSVSTPVNPLGEDYYVVVNLGNDEGDTPFWDADAEDMRYDIPPTYFHGEQKRLLDMLMDESKNSNMIEKCSYKFGAERNG
jgi:hypothetical protein